MRRIKPFAIAGTILGLLTTSCSNQELCLSNQNSVQVGLYSAYSPSKDKDTTLKNVTIYGLGRTDTLYNDATLTEAFLPLSYSDKEPDTTSFVLSINNVLDTLQFIHTKQLDFVSGECGYVFEFGLNKVGYSNFNIDTIKTSNPVIKYSKDAENIKVYIY
jgi:hypothetical protein